MPTVQETVRKVGVPWGGDGLGQAARRRGPDAPVLVCLYVVPRVCTPCARRRRFRPRYSAGKRLPEVAGTTATVLFATQVLVYFQLRELGGGGQPGPAVIGPLALW